MLRNVSLLAKRMKPDSPTKQTQQLAGTNEQTSPLADRSANASSFFPSNQNSTANLAQVVKEVVVLDTPKIIPDVEGVEGDAKIWSEALATSDIATLALQLKSESSSNVDREINDVSLCSISVVYTG
jgi:hypothetical protein